MPVRRQHLRFVVVVFTVGAAQSGRAQILPPDETQVGESRNVAVRERIIPGYEVAGIPVGSFRLYPGMSITARYDDNIFALDTPRKSALVLRASPNVRLQSSWARTSLTLSANADFDRVPAYKSENADALDASAYLTHVLGSDTGVRAYARYRSGREGRDAQSTFALTERPIAFRTQTAGLAVAQRFAKARLSAQFGIVKSNFDDGRFANGTAFDQDYRDSTLKRAVLRAEIVQSPSLGYFVQGTIDDTDYRQPASPGLARGSQSTEILVGARFDLPVLMRGEISAGYLNARYQGVLFRKFSGLAVATRLQMFPTQLTTITVTGQRRVNDAGLPNSSGYLETSAGLQVDHELLRSLILGAYARSERNTFNGIDRRDRRIIGGLSADYRANRILTFRLTFDHLDLRSTGLDRYKSFGSNRITVSAGVRI
jgi:hypothetical protein